VENAFVSSYWKGRLRGLKYKARHSKKLARSLLQNKSGMVVYSYNLSYVEGIVILGKPQAKHNTLSVI
jgi:hypothetical protein